MASIKRYHQAACTGGDCDCPWRLDYRPQGLAGARKRIEFPTKKAAEKYLAATAAKVARGEYISPDKIPTFARAGQTWLRDKADRHPATAQGWRVHLEHLTKLDNVRLDRIDVAAVERVRDELRVNLGAKTISAILTTCTAVFKLAQRRGWTTNNPAAIAERPRRAVAELTIAGKVEESEKGLRAVRPDEVLSADEIKKLLDHADPGLYRTLFATVAATGMRPEEAYALRWTDVLLDSAQISIRRSLSWSRGLEEQAQDAFRLSHAVAAGRTCRDAEGLETTEPAVRTRSSLLSARRPTAPALECFAPGSLPGATAGGTAERQRQDLTALICQRTHRGRRAHHRGSTPARAFEPSCHAQGLLALV